MVTMALRLLPPLAWSGLIAWFSGVGWSGGATMPLFEPWLRALLPWAAPEQIAGAHWLLRKTGHVVEYAVLARLCDNACSQQGCPDQDRQRQPETEPGPASTPVWDHRPSG
ncbi:MAG: hypothetical protein ACREJS_16405, partial [Candidatus Rokuibacteriota bacterium]